MDIIILSKFYRALVREVVSNNTIHLEWLFVECDGLPCNMIRDIISEVLRCQLCNRCFWGREAFEEHNCFQAASAKSKKEFGWLVPIFGLLRLEMNIGRAFVKLNWDVFVRSSGFTLGFQSPKASAYLHKGADHHKLWHLLEIKYIYGYNDGAGLSICKRMH